MKKIFFHSYKGGVGRSFILINMAFRLSRDGYKIGIVDLDYDAPSMLHLLSQSIGEDIRPKEKDVIYILWANSPAELAEAIIKIRNFEIYLLPSNPIAVSEAVDYLHKLATDPEKDLSGMLGNIFDDFIDIKELDYLFVDMRPGHTFLINTLISKSDHVVQVFRLTPQDFLGTKMLCDALGPGKKGILIPSLVPMEIDEHRQYVSESLTKISGESLGSNIFIPLMIELFIDERELESNSLISKNSRSVRYEQYIHTLDFIIRRIQNGYNNVL